MAKHVSTLDIANHEADDGAASCSKWIKTAEDLWNKVKAESSDPNSPNEKYIFNPHLKKEDKTNVPKYKCTEAIGFIKHAFVLAFYYLKKAAETYDNGESWYDLDDAHGKSLYYESIKETISLGGDTDTNACIVGGMVGAYVGARNLNNYGIDHEKTL